MKVKGFISEFKNFITRGNVMDMAVGVLIGGAFSSIVTSLTDDIISPILGLFGGANFDMLHVNILGEVTLNYGKFLTAVVNFLLMAAIIFLMLKALHTLQAKTAQLTGSKEEPAATTKTCPYCMMEIPIKAVRCGHCTSILEIEAECGCERG
ncbi:MAG: large conductance mechanosensitive channel protein MscL [Lachnospiraceae bacterium]|nr:large conductance mechanosensitive channel protein MscL [Lachnospiraceae bacterium]